MKKIFIIASVTFLLAACKDILTESPKAIVVERFYQNANDLETAVNSIFAPLRAYNCFGALYPWQTEIYSDFQLGRGSYAVLNEYEGLDNTNVTRIGQMWNEFYLAIRNANLVIANAENAVNATPAEIAKYVGEARFLRAFSYFCIIPYFGKLPIRTEENISDTEVPLSSAEAVFSLILDDLTFAEQNLPETASVPGRPTKWAAKAVLSHVHFYRNDYPTARAKAAEIINSNAFSLVEVKNVDDWQKLYGPTVVTTPEEIFYIKNSQESGWSYVEFLHHPSDPYYNGRGLFASYMDTVILSKRWNEWDPNDLRKQLYYSWEFGLGPHTMLNNKFMDTEHIGQGANDYPFYRYADVLLIYSESDARVANSISTEALEKLNRVRRRAYDYSPLQPSPIDFTESDFPDLNTFLETVIMERAYESYYEGGKRWLDLLRLGRDYTRKVIREVHHKEIAERHFLWPLPSVEIDLNDAISETEQNPGY